VPTTVAPRTGRSVTAVFLAHLPRCLALARFAFHRVGCPHARADRVAETVALAWRHFAALSRRGKKPEEFVTTLALRCSQAVKAGRRLAGCETGQDVLSLVARVRHGLRVTRLPDRDRVSDRHPLPGALADPLADNTRSAVPEQAAFRVDFPRWRATLRRRDRKILAALAGGERTADAARRFKISPGRVSQLRREFEQSWERFQAN
jgi:DNA-directed RNA polymerase specialized sigma24 family protein